MDLKSKIACLSDIELRVHKFGGWERDKDELKYLLGYTEFGWIIEI